jgi:DnaJ-class molecular chaperone
MGTRVHLDEEECWCGPLYIRPCPECETKGDIHGATCWNCKGAMFVAGQYDDENVIPIHIEFEEED